MSTDEQAVDFWGKTPADYERSRRGNAMLTRHRDAAAGHTGTLGAKASVQPTEMGERLSQALSDLESAERRKDPDDVGFCEHRLDELVAESRAERERPRNEDGTFMSDEQVEAASDFGGGVSRRSKPTPSGGQESSNQLFQRMLGASREERRERGAEHTVTTNAA